MCASLSNIRDFAEYQLLALTVRICKPPGLYCFWWVLPVRRELACRSDLRVLVSPLGRTFLGLSCSSACQRSCWHSLVSGFRHFSANFMLSSRCHCLRCRGLCLLLAVGSQARLGADANSTLLLSPTAPPTPSTAISTHILLPHRSHFSPSTFLFIFPPSFSLLCIHPSSGSRRSLWQRRGG